MPDGASTPESLTERLFWTRHASPYSVWLLVLTYPLLVAALYRRSRSLFAAVGLSVVLSLWAVSPPEDDAAWATRVVRGERVWLDRGLRSEPGAVALLAVGAVVQLFTLRSALKRRRTRTGLGTVGSLGLMGLFFDRMVQVYEAHAADTGGHDA